MTFLIPSFSVMKRGGKAIGKELLSTSGNILNDLAADNENSSFQDILERHGKTAVKNLKRKALNSMKGGSYTPTKKRKISKQKIKKVLKKKTSSKKKSVAKQRSKSVKRKTVKKRKSQKSKKTEYPFFN